MRMKVDSIRYLYQHTALKEENWLRKAVQQATTEPSSWAEVKIF